jgi:hypothetical protein
MSNIGLANRHLIKCMQFDNIIAKAISKSVADAERIRAIAYSMDTLVPGFYVWFGFAIVLPGCHIFTTYTGSDDPRQASD